MSRHHRPQQHQLAKRRHTLTPLVQSGGAVCHECGKPIVPGQAWDTGHRTPASQGGQASSINTGAVHRTCNRSAGGRMGAAVTNQARRRTRDRSNDIREW